MLVGEKWRAAPGYQGLYEVSDRGRIRSLPRRVPVQCYANGLWYERTSPGKILKPSRDRNGHMMIKVSANGIKRRLTLHRAICLAFNGEPPPGLELARHLDDDKSNNVPSNLAWGTHAMNSADRRRNGHGVNGERNPNARLTLGDVRKIRATTRPASELAQIFKVSPTTIRHCRAGRTWADA